MQQTQDLQLYDIYDVYYNPWFLQSWFLAILGGLVLCLIGYLVYRWYKKREKPKMTYWQETLAIINRLEMAELTESPKEFYSLLTAAFKNYITQRFQAPLASATDQEFLAALQSNSAIPTWIYDDAQQIFEGLMFVKFAHGQAGLERMMHDVKIFKTIVLKTLPKKEEAP